MPLEKMNVAEKLRVLEEIWDDLCHADDAVPSPEWHKDELDVRAQRVQDGTTTFVPLDEAKRRVRDQLA